MIAWPDPNDSPILEAFMANSQYPDLERFSKSIEIPAENLVKAFEIEKIFHKQILCENSFEKRKAMYSNVYNTVHPIYGKNTTEIQQERNPKDRIVQLFKKELGGKSILDVGCGQGYFLQSISKQLKHKQLVGIDVSIPPISRIHTDIEFISADIIKFDMDKQFDVVFSDQLLEHVAPPDLSMHLRSIKGALKSRGLFIVNLPNRLFGPSDVTRMIDFSYTGRTEAQGTHLNESTYGELIPILERNGFKDFKTVLPIPKLKYMLKNFRMNPSLLVTIEKNKFMMNLLHNIKLRGQCIAKFGITLICRKY